MAIQRLNKKTINGKPFVKWAGGKRNLVNILESQLPSDFNQQNEITYIEPFVGGGAFLFHLLAKHENISNVIINDINKDLIHCYRLIKKDPKTLIALLKEIEGIFYSCNSNQKKRDFYIEKRALFNENKMSKDERAACFIFMNHTCFNGLYRENGEGEFNVPFGWYKNPKICNTEVIMADHTLLKNVKIHVGDYYNIKNRISQGYNFIYLDPPYRPLAGCSNFKEYSKNGFGDKEQNKLKRLCDFLNDNDCKIMLSNSFSKNEDGSSYFEELYSGYQVDKILAHRFINAYADTRKKTIELLIKNYNNPSKALQKSDYI